MVALIAQNNCAPWEGIVELDDDDPEWAAYQRGESVRMARLGYLYATIQTVIVSAVAAWFYGPRAALLGLIIIAFWVLPQLVMTGRLPPLR